MARKSAKKKRAARKSNPFGKVRASQKKFKPARHHRRKRNPELGSLMAQPVEFLKFGLIALLGLVATRQVPQMALGARNAGIMGYAANLGTAVAGAYGAGKFAGNRAAIAFGTGGGLYTVNRILTDKLTPVGQVLSLAGVGDAHAANSLGRIVPGGLYPSAYNPDGTLRLPQTAVDAFRRLIPPSSAAAASGMSGTRRQARVSIG